MLWTYTQHNFAGGRLDKELMGRQDLTQYFKGSSELRNFLIRRQGNLAKRRGTNLACNLAGISISKYRLIPLVFSKDEGFYLLLSGGYAYLCNKNGVRDIDGNFSKEVTTANVYRVASGVSDARIDNIDFVQSGDTVFIVHHEIAPMKIVFYRNEVSHVDNDTGEKVVDHPALSLERTNLNFNAARGVAPNCKAVTASDMTHPAGEQSGAKKYINYKFTIVDSNGVESFPSGNVKVSYNLPWRQGGKFSIELYTAGADTPKPAAYNIYKDDGSGYGFIGTIVKDLIADTTISGKAYRNYGTFDDDCITPDMSSTPPDATTRKLFDKAGEYPSVVSLYQQRLVFGGSDADPFTFWMSCTGDLYNFSTHASILESDAITATLAATEQPEINHALLAKELMLFANSGEWEVAPISGNTLSYKTVSAKMQSAIGAARWVKPIIVGDEIIFVDYTGERMLATRYNYATDGYESLDLTVLSQWMFRNNMIKRMAYRAAPDSTIYCAMEDGAVNSLVYMKEHEVCAWSRHDLGGGYLAKDVACSKAVSRGSTDVIYLVQNASTKKYELWCERDDLPIRSANSVADFICMDRCADLATGGTVPAGMTAVGKTTAKIFSAGSIVTENALVGYPFESKFESIYPDSKDGDGGAQMEIMNPTEAKIRVIDSSSFSFGACADLAANDTKVDIPVKASAGKITLLDAEAKAIFSGVNSRDSRIRILHSEPFPLNVLSITATYQVEAENQNGGGNDR